MGTKEKRKFARKTRHRVALSASAKQAIRPVGQQTGRRRRSGSSRGRSSSQWLESARRRGTSTGAGGAAASEQRDRRLTRLGPLLDGVGLGLLEALARDRGETRLPRALHFAERERRVVAGERDLLEGNRGREAGHGRACDQSQMREKWA